VVKTLAMMMERHPKLVVFIFMQEICNPRREDWYKDDVHTGEKMLGNMLKTIFEVVGLDSTGITNNFGRIIAVSRMTLTSVPPAVASI
jgi:hypothetical protein